MKIKIPNYLTIGRIIIVPIFVFTFYLPGFYGDVIPFALFVIASFTDFLDGYIARKTKTESNIGALLDLLADKILVSLSLIWLIYLYQDAYIFVPSLIIISRELIISSIRQYIVEKSEGKKIEVSFIGKSKTTLQLVAISMLFLLPIFGRDFYLLTISILWMSSFISIFSLYTYLVKWKSSF